MNCLIVDDEPLALAQLAGYISRIPFLKLIASCQDAHQASKVLASHTIDLLFVDINMPDLNGIEFVRSLPQAPMIIFTTAYSEYAIEGFRLNAVDYLTKPFDLGDCLKAAEKARKMYSMAHNTSQAQTDWDDKERTLFVKSEYKMIRINIDKIIYIESMSEYICIYLEDRNKPVITLNSLQKFSTLLPPLFHACTPFLHCQSASNYRSFPFPDSLRERYIYTHRRELQRTVHGLHPAHRTALKRPVRNAD